jgi:hypothetical protein
MSDKPISPLRQRMLEDMNMRRGRPVISARRWFATTSSPTVCYGCAMNTARPATRRTF